MEGLASVATLSAVSAAVAGVWYAVNSHILAILRLVGDLLGLHSWRILDSTFSQCASHVKYASEWRDEEPFGLIWGSNFVGYSVYDMRTDDKHICIICSKSTYDRMFKDTLQLQKNKNIKSKTMMFLEQELGRDNYYYRRHIPLLSKTPRPHQQQIIKSIMDYYAENHHCIALVYGKPGLGKSIIPFMICEEFLKTTHHASLVDTYSMIGEKDNFRSLYNSANPNRDNPLIVLMDEIDGIVKTVHKNTKNKIKTGRRRGVDLISSNAQINDKKSWNQFMDRFDRKLYPYVIFYMTSNKPLSYFDSMDPSYMRDQRVSLRIDMNTLVGIESQPDCNVTDESDNDSSVGLTNRKTKRKHRKPEISSESSSEDNSDHPDNKKNI